MRESSRDRAAAGESAGSAKGEPILGSFASLGSGEVLARAVAFLGTAYLARVLGPYGFGVVGFATALCGYLALAVTAGFDGLGAREVARRPERAGAIAGGVVLVRLALALGAVALTVVLSRWLDKPEVVRLVVILSSLSFVTLAADTGWVYKGLGRNGRVGIALVLAQVLYVVAVLATVRGPDDLLRVPIAVVAGELGGALFLGLPLARTAPRPDFKGALELLRSSGALTLSRLLRSLIFTFDIVLLGFLLGEREVGLYSAAYRFCLLALAVGISLHTAYLPRFARIPGGRPEETGRLTGSGLDAALALALPMVAGGAILARPLLAALFGEPYAEAAGAFRLLLLSIGLIYLHGILHNVFLTLHRLRQETWVMAAAALFNVAACLVLIPRFGMAGAAAATAGAEVLVLAASLWLCRRLGVAPRLDRPARTLVAVAAMAALLLLWGPSGHWLLRLAAGAALYFGLLAVLGAIPPELDPRTRRPSDPRRP